MKQNNTVTIPSEFYAANVSDRDQYETRAKDIAAISIPYIIRETSDNGNTSLKKSPSQSFNGRMFNNLKAKMGMALLPPATSSFRLSPNAQQMKDLFGADNTSDDIVEQLRKELSVNTDAINKEIENQQIRSSLFDMLLQLLAVGSVVIEKVEKKGIVIYPLQSFVVKLNSKGEPLALCVKETLYDNELPDNIVPKDSKDEYELYTLFKYDKDTDKWIMTQDIDGDIVGDGATYKTYDDLPFRYFGWTWLSGDSYHRPFAEDYYPDMEQVDKLAKLNTDGAIIAAKSLLLVNQRGGRTRKEDIAASPNGGVIDGSADDVTSFQFGKNYDFQVSNDRENIIKKELMQCFLDTGSVQRDAERVTAEEIRVMAQQLESSTLAGIYSKMALSWSKWIVEKVMKELKITFKSIDVAVLTGLDALGRSQEAQKMDTFMQRVTQLQLNAWIKDNELLQRYASFDGINTVGLLKTSKEVQQEQQAAQKAAQEQQMMQTGAQQLGQDGVKKALGMN